MIIRSFLFSLAVCFFGACKNKPVVNKSGDTYSIRFQPKQGVVVSYSILNDITMGQEMNKEKTKSRNKTEAELEYEFTKDNTGGYILQSTYKAFKTLIKTDDDEKKIDAATAAKSDDPAEQIFALFQNKKFTAAIDSAGQVQKIEGIDDLLGKIKEATKYAGNAAGQSFINETFFKKAVTTGSSFYPGKPVKIGDTWTSEQLIDETLNVKTKRTLKLETVEDNVATIKITGVILNDNANMNVAGQQVAISFDGGEEGYVLIDVTTGLIVKSKISAKGDGAITVMNTSVPLTFKSTIEIIKK